MKKLLLTITATVFMTLSPVTVAQEQEQESMCETYAGLAEDIMWARQNGKPMVETMKIVEFDGFLKKVTQWAYEENLYTTDEYKQRAITEFSNNIYAGCLAAQDEE